MFISAVLPQDIFYQIKILFLKSKHFNYIKGLSSLLLLTFANRSKGFYLKSRVDFTNMFTWSANCKSAKRQSSHQFLFAHLESSHVKVFVKRWQKRPQKPGREFTKLLRQIWKIFHNFKVLLQSSYS